MITMLLRGKKHSSSKTNNALSLSFSSLFDRLQRLRLKFPRPQSFVAAQIIIYSNLSFVCVFSLNFFCSKVIKYYENKFKLQSNYTMAN